jgi:prefoldin subunit 5
MFLDSHVVVEKGASYNIVPARTREAEQIKALEEDIKDLKKNIRDLQAEFNELSDQNKELNTQLCLRLQELVSAKDALIKALS